MSEPYTEIESLSLSSLPQSILEDVITFVRRSIQYDGYICELRRVSRRFNEAVLHCLGFRDTPRDFLPWHLMSCPSEDASCHRPGCGAVGGCNHIYARYRLQADMQMSKANTTDASKFYGTLAKALELFREQLSHDGTASLQVHDVNLFSSLCQSAVFADASSILFCEASLTLLKVVTRDWHDRNLSGHDLIDRGAWFWLKNLACYKGNIKLFEFYDSLARSIDSDSATLPRDLEAFLITCAARGHSTLFHHILRQASPSYALNLEHALREACCSGCVEIVHMVLEACPMDKAAKLCEKALRTRHISRRVSQNYSAAASLLVNKCGQVTDLDFHLMLSQQAALGASSVVALLLRRYRKRTFWPPALSILTVSVNPLWCACVNADLECVRTLIRNHYFTKMGLDEIRGLCLQSTEAAVKANSFAICQELCAVMGVETSSLSFNYLASVDGSLESMTRKFAINPGMLSMKECKSDKHTIGQLALGRAATFLRVDNTKFMLEKGVRLDNTTQFEPLVIEWRRKRANERRFHAVQELLKSYGLLQLQVEL